MNTPLYPGTPRHQALLRAVASFYTADPRILAVAVFGSLGRGAWDQYSDLDLDVVLADDMQIDVIEELHCLCASFATIDEHALIIEPDDDDAGDVVLASLIQLSIRYHLLHTTSPNITDSLLVLVSQIDADVIKRAGQANRNQPNNLLAASMNHAMRRA